jgi:hypothetical protein
MHSIPGVGAAATPAVVVLALLAGAARMPRIDVWDPVRVKIPMRNSFILTKTSTSFLLKRERSWVNKNLVRAKDEAKVVMTETGFIYSSGSCHLLPPLALMTVHQRRTELKKWAAELNDMVVGCQLSAESTQLT